MLNQIISFSVKNKFIIGLFVVALIGFGTYEVTKLPIDAVPDITDNQVQVITVAPSLGASDIERLITFPVEQANSNISGLKEIRSFSRFGLSLVTIVFDEKTDLYWARQQIAERLLKVKEEIPPGIGNPELGPITTGLGEIYQYVVRPKKGYEDRYDETELRTIQDWIIRRQLLGVKGVAEVSSFGGKLKQYEVAVNLPKLQAAGITLNDIFSALENNNQNTGGTYIEKNETALFIRSEGLLTSIEDIENVLVKENNSGAPVFIRDIASVRPGYATRYGALCYNDEGEVAGAVVMMLKGANSSEVVSSVKERIRQIQSTLPEGVVIEPFLDRSKMVDNAIRTVKTNLAEGALIVVFILVLFLGNIRAGLLVASIIPLSMLFAIIMMNLFGVSGNLMSLGALDFGLIVDGSVIIVEAVMHQLIYNKTFQKLTRISQLEMNTTVSQSASKMMNSAVFGQIIILIVYLPIFSLEGIEGKMFKPMAQTVTFAFIGAFILSLTYIPMMSSLVLSKKIKHSKGFSDKVMDRLSFWFKHQLVRVLKMPKTVIGAVSVLFIAAIIMLSRMGGEFIPSLEEGDFAVESRIMTGSNLNATKEKTQYAARILLNKFPEIEKIVTKIGSGEIPTDPMPLEAGDMMVILKDKKEWTSASSFPELSQKMSKELEQVAGLSVGFQFPVQMRFNELMTGARQDVVCKIFGENMDTLSSYAQQLGTIIQTVEGARDLFIEPVGGMPQVVIEYKRPVMAQYGLTVNEVNKIINTAFAGEAAGMIFEEERRFDLVLKLDQEQRKSLEDIRALMIPLSSGQQIPLSQVADVVLKDGPNQIQREDAKRRIITGFNISGRDVQSIVSEVQKKVKQQMKLPSGYYIVYGGAFENLEAAKSRLLIAVPVALLLIFILLYFAFRSVKQGLLIYSAIPLSAIGGIYFLFFRGMPFSISAGIGFIALFGVAVLNGIVLITEFNRLKRKGLKNIYHIVTAGTASRLRPVLMTASVASLGFLPMAVSNGAGAEVQRPLATVVIGGLLIATFLTLFLLPVLYVLSERSSGDSRKQSVAIALLLVLLYPSGSFAQQPISLSAAIDTALKNNFQVKNEQLKAQYQQQLIKASRVIETTSAGFEIGQINSIYTDNRFNIGQSFQFPTVYARQASVADAAWKNAVLGVSLKEAEITRSVRSVFYKLLVLEQQLSLLEQIDSIYALFLTKASSRVELGESNLLERISAENTKGVITMQLEDLRTELETTRLEFLLLLNSNTDYAPSGAGIKYPFSVQSDSIDPEMHPLMKQLKQEQLFAHESYRLERSRLLPGISLGYANSSMRGTGADDVFYSGSKRFHSGQVGLSLPLFFGAQKARIRAAGAMEAIRSNEYALQQQLLRTNFRRSLIIQQNLLKKIDYFENSALKNAESIFSVANQQYDRGEIDYIRWVMVISQATEIRAGYLKTIRELNDNSIEINYLLSR